MCLQGLGVFSSSDRSILKRRIKEIQTAVEKERKALDKMEKQKEKQRRKDQEQRRNWPLPAGGDRVWWGGRRETWPRAVLERHEHYDLSLSIVFCWNNKSEQYIPGCLLWCPWRTNQQHSVLFKSGKMLFLTSMFLTSKFGSYFSRNVYEERFLK